MPTYKVSELEGWHLCEALAKALGFRPDQCRWHDGRFQTHEPINPLGPVMEWQDFNLDWVFTGKLIDRFKVWICWVPPNKRDAGFWDAALMLDKRPFPDDDGEQAVMFDGYAHDVHTAVARAVVKSKLGEEVELP